MASCTERFGNKVEGFIAGSFDTIGLWVGSRPRKTIAAAFFLTVLMGIGFMSWETENRENKLWVPQDTIAEAETEMYQEYFPSSSRFNQMIVQTAATGQNVLTKELLVEAMKMHMDVETGEFTVDGVTDSFLGICTPAGGTCASSSTGVCECLVNSILKQWNYDLETLQNDDNFMVTLNMYGSKDDLRAVIGNAQFDEDGNVTSAEAFSLSYFIQDQSETVNGDLVDTVGDAWEKEVFLATASSVPSDFPELSVTYVSDRSFGDEFGDAIEGDLLLVQISYVMAFLFLGANLGRAKCGTGSRWTMALGALMTVGLSTAAGFGLSSLCGLFFGPVHSILPFILLGIGVDDAFVIVNAFDRERKGPRTSESNDELAKRSSRALARAGASITVTSATDMVAFGISSSSSLPALASFCAFASICIFFLWLFASTFFTATLVIDERRQRDNRRECLCCITRKNPINEEDDDGFEESFLSRYFRNHHAPAILSSAGKAIVLVIFAGLLGFGIYGAMNLEVEDTERAFIPEESYLTDWIEAADEYFPSTGIDLFFVFEGSSEIYDKRQLLADLDGRLAGLSSDSPYIAEPVSENAFQNVMTGLNLYLNTSGTEAIGNATLGGDNWPTSEEDFILTLTNYASLSGPGAKYAQDIAMSEGGDAIDAFRVHSEYVRLTKVSDGDVIDDADRQIEAMDDTRAFVTSWTDLPAAFPYSEKFITIEGFKIIRRELFMNVGLAIAAVGLIIFLTVASPMTAFLITLNVAFCIVEILGFMQALGIVIDSISVINIVLAVGLSVDYSAHVGHSFMTKRGDDKNQRVIEALADIGAAVLNGALSTFLAVVVLLFSSSYVFVTLSRQFALTVALGITHGLVLLPVMLALFGPKPYSSIKETEEDQTERPKVLESDRADEGDNTEADKKSGTADDEACAHTLPSEWKSQKFHVIKSFTERRAEILGNIKDLRQQIGLAATKDEKEAFEGSLALESMALKDLNEEQQDADTEAVSRRDIVKMSGNQS